MLAVPPGSRNYTIRIGHGVPDPDRVIFGPARLSARFSGSGALPGLIPRLPAGLVRIPGHRARRPCSDHLSQDDHRGSALGRYGDGKALTVRQRRGPGIPLGTGDARSRCRDWSTARTSADAPMLALDSCWQVLWSAWECFTRPCIAWTRSHLLQVITPIIFARFISLSVFLRAIGGGLRGDRAIAGATCRWLGLLHALAWVGIGLTRWGGQDLIACSFWPAQRYSDLAHPLADPDRFPLVKAMCAIREETDVRDPILVFPLESQFYALPIASSVVGFTAIMRESSTIRAFARITSMQSAKRCRPWSSCGQLSGGRPPTRPWTLSIGGSTGPRLHRGIHPRELHSSGLRRRANPPAPERRLNSSQRRCLARISRLASGGWPRVMYPMEKGLHGQGASRG